MQTIPEDQVHRQRILSLRNSVLDLDAEVDTIRTEIDASIERLTSAVRERDRVARKLADLLGAPA